MIAEIVPTNIENNWTWAATIAGFVLGLTALSGYLNQERKDELALWLMGAQSEERWSRIFVSYFDAVFGSRHLSLQCFLRSVVASMIAVVLLWLLMGSAASVGVRLKAHLGLGSIIILGFAINVVADYVSLLETRWLLGHMPRRVLPQVGILIFDLLVSAAIIWFAILSIQMLINGPLAALAPPEWRPDGEVESFAEILGLFSIFSVFFYSTFLTSVWTWSYIASTWLLRIFVQLRLAYWFDVEHKPVQILAYVIAAVAFAGTLGLSGLLKQHENGVTVADRALCSVFKGRVCIDVAGLTPTEQAKIEFVSLACEGGVTDQCIDRGLEIYEIDGATAAKLWGAACEGGSLIGCSNLGALHESGNGVKKDPAEAFRLYKLACDGGEMKGCSNAGALYEGGLGVAQDLAEARRYYEQACAGGGADGCFNLGLIFDKGVGVKADPAEAARQYRLGCDAGAPSACLNLGFLYTDGPANMRDRKEGLSLYVSACEHGSGVACNNAGNFYEAGKGTPSDLAKAAEFFSNGCDLDNGDACASLGVLYHNGTGIEPDPAEAALLLRRGCDLGASRSCNLLGDLLVYGDNVDQDLEQAANAYLQGCDAGHGLACAQFGQMHLQGRGLKRDPILAADYNRRACDLGEAIGCLNLGFMYQFGTGVSADRAEALKLVRPFCDLIGEKCEDVMSYFEDADGAALTGLETVVRLTNACDSGSLRDCVFLAGLYRDGLGVPLDIGKSLSLAKRGCEAGVADGCLQAGTLLAAGFAIEQDKDEAERLIGRACALGLNFICGDPREVVADSQVAGRTWPASLPDR